MYAIRENQAPFIPVLSDEGFPAVELNGRSDCYTFAFRINRMLKILKGVFLAAFAGCCWGSMAVAAQYLFTDCGFQARHLTTLRLIGAGVLLLALQATLGGFKSILKPFQAKRNIRDILIYGVGVLLIQYTFFLAIEQSNAGTAAIMVGVGPLFIIGYSALGKHRKPVPKEFLCLFLAITGVALVVTKGNFKSLDFVSTGAFWGLLSSAFGAFCTVQPKNVISRVGVSNVVGWGMIVGGTMASMFTNPLSMDVHWTIPAILCYFQIIAFGTVAAFWCYLKSTEYVIPSITAILGSFEPLSAVVLSVLLLGATFNSYELLGAAAILANMLILAWPSNNTKSLSAD